MIETFTRCATCRTDTRLGLEVHCPLCHTNYEKGAQHTCRVLDEAIEAEREPSTIPARYKRAQVVFLQSGPSTGARDWGEVNPMGVPFGE